VLNGFNMHVACSHIRLAYTATTPNEVSEVRFRHVETYDNCSPLREPSVIRSDQVVSYPITWGYGRVGFHHGYCAGNEETIDQRTLGEDGKSECQMSARAVTTGLNWYVLVLSSAAMNGLPGIQSPCTNHLCTYIFGGPHTPGRLQPRRPCAKVCLVRYPYRALRHRDTRPPHETSPGISHSHFCKISSSTRSCGSLLSIDTRCTILYPFSRFFSRNDEVHPMDSGTSRALHPYDHAANRDVSLCLILQYQRYGAT
jgi:hypothetical protein